MVNISDVAKKAGVSTSTVSRVMNNKGAISLETSKRVLEAARELGYEPNMLARSFRKQETRIILVLVPNFTNPYYTNIMSGISDTTRKLGYSSFICNTQGDPAQEREVLNMLDKKKADGAILLGTQLGTEWLKPYAEAYPIVQCSEYDPAMPIPHVCIDNYQAARDIVSYLSELGHRRIATISSENCFISTKLRLDGYRDELEARQILYNDEYLFFAARDYTFESGYEGAKKLLMLEDRPTALFCISDVLALGALLAAADLGLRVPEDLTVIGFDDVEGTTRYHPYITTLEQPCYQIGAKAAELLRKFIKTPRPGESDILRQKYEFLLPYRLIERESSGPAPRSIN